MKTRELERWSKDDGLWERLLSAMGTMGGIKGSVLVHEERYHRRVTWAALSALHDHDERLARLAYMMGRADVSHGPTKAGWLTANFERICSMGGPKRAKQRLEALRGREAKIEFLREFQGIGPKYARNVLMDVYDVDFRESIAIDARISNITRALGRTFNTYADEETFYLDLAHRAGLSGHWTSELAQPLAIRSTRG